MNIKQGVKILSALSFVLSFPANSAIYWSAQKITNNSYGDSEPVLSDTHIAWMCRPSGNTEICAYDGTTITQLTTSTQNEQNLSTSEKYIAWNWRDSDDGDDIFLYDGTTIAQITDTTTAQFRPVVHGERMVWGRTGGDVILYDIASKTSKQLVPPGSFGTEIDPWIFGNSVTLKSNQGVGKLYLYDITLDTFSYIGITSNQSKINDNYVAYDYYDGDLEIKVLDRAVGSRQVTNNSVSDGNIQLSDKYLVWGSNAGDSSYNDELYLYDASDSISPPMLIASNVSYYDAASIDGNLVVYSGWDGNDWEIYVYDMAENSTQQISNNGYPDRNPKVRGERIVWDVYEGTEELGDSEIILAIPGTPPEDVYFIIKSKNGNSSIINL